MSVTIQLRRGTAAQWTAANTLLAVGEVGLETDTGQFKIGDGVMPWSARPYGGIVGPAGPTGPIGQTGPAGAASTVPGPQGATGLSGASGSAGLDGKTVRSGSSVPSAGLGVDGDFYVNTAANTIYGPKTAGAWGSATSLVGPAGGQGIQGIQGVQGQTGPGGPATCRATSDTANSSSTTPSDIAGLSFALTAGVTYAFEFRVIFQSAATTTGIALSVTFPAMTIFAARAEIPIAADGAGGDFQGWITASDDLVIGTGVQAATTNYLAVIRGQCMPSANGTLQARVRSEVNASAVTVKAGSCGILQTIP